VSTRSLRTGDCPALRRPRAWYCRLAQSCRLDLEAPQGRTLHLQGRFEASERRACRVVGQGRSTQRKAPQGPLELEERLRAWLRGFSARHPRWGWRRASALARKAGFAVNAKRVQRLWRDEGLKVPYKAKKKAPLGLGVQVGAFCPIRPNVAWGCNQGVTATSPDLEVSCNDDPPKLTGGPRCSDRGRSRRCQLPGRRRR
jgi:HTH-like domain